MNRVALLAALLLAGCASAPSKPTAKPHVETLKDDTAGVVVISLGNAPLGLVFVSKTGKAFAITVDDCGKTPACAELVTVLDARGSLSVLDLGGQSM